MTPEQREEKLRTAIAHWFAERVKRRKSFKLPDLVNEAVGEFAGQPGFAKEFVQALAYPMFYSIATQQIGSMRALRSGDYVFARGLSAEEAAERVERRAARPIFERWLHHVEHCGDRYVHLVEMTKMDIRMAKEERGKRVRAEQQMIELLTRLARRLKGDQRVSDRWSLEEIENVAQSIEKAS